MLSIQNAAEFNRGIDNWLAQVEELAVGTLRGLSVKLFEAVLQNSPQYSGNAVANWRYSVNGKDTSSTDFFKTLMENTLKEKGYANAEEFLFSKSRPSRGAHDAAISESSGREKDVHSLADVIYISNSVDYDEWLAEATEADLRSANHVGHLISHSTLDVLEGHLVITTRKAEELGRERIG